MEEGGRPLMILGDCLEKMRLVPDGRPRRTKVQAVCRDREGSEVLRDRPLPRLQCVRNPRLVEASGDVDAERFTTLTIREPQDDIELRKQNMHVGESSFWRHAMPNMRCTGTMKSK